ncbi:hemerythrin domain-containing protein [Kribbella sp. NPDC026611]|uniref:hemerythrin domain-containing protein n=1 Tax=Kribbella sp. NPDC026611 TaxID=3154911 RepID=UPI0033EF0DA5
MATFAPGNQDDLISVIIRGHRAAEQAFLELASGHGTPQHRRDLADRVTTELTRHSAAKALYLYPSARKLLPDGDQLADDDLAGHAELERSLENLAGVEATNPAFAGLLGTVIAAARHHIDEEEQQLLPRLQQACDDDELLALGRRFTARNHS